MPTTLEAPRDEKREPDIHTFEHHWQDEADAAYLYRILAAAEPDQHKKDIYSRLAEVEDRHVIVWGDLMTSHGHPPKNSSRAGGRSFWRESVWCSGPDSFSRCCFRRKDAR